jgi:phosphotriesterase-related protein
MKQINTFKGPMPLDKYKKILAHEHLLIDLTHEAVAPASEEDKKVFYSDIDMEILGVLRRNPYIVRTNLILDNEDDAIHEMKYVERHGVDLILDLTSHGLKRNMTKLRKISENINLDVVIGTGFFVHDALDERESALKADEMAAIMLDEIENGIEGTGIKAGVIGEVGVSEKIYPVEHESILAAAMVHNKTGLPIYLHTYPWSRAGLEAAELLIENGVEPKYICICHIDVTFDHEYLKLILDRGIYIEFDNCGKEFFFEPQEGAFAGGPFATDVERVAMLKQLISEGYGKQIIISNDICLKAGLHKYGGWGYDHIFQNFVPMMRYGKISEEDIDLIAIENPIRFLKGEDL